MFFYRVTVDVPLNKTFIYTSQVELPIGKRVLVEFITKRIVGFIWESLSIEKVDYDLDKIKPILGTFDEILPADIIRLVEFTSEYYHCPIGQTLFTAIPVLFRKAKKIAVNHYTNVRLIAPNHPIFNNKLSVKHKQVYSLLQTSNISSRIIKDIVGGSYKQLLNKWADLRVIDFTDIKPAETIIGSKLLLLNEQQKSVSDSISAGFGGYMPTILYGITGSGKTEVYLDLIAKVLQSGKQVLVLVPEINLTPQLLDRFKQRFFNINMHILTSSVSDRDRVLGYLEAQLGYSQIIIGTRMAVFTPFASLGLIIVDEEHDLSFKQNEGLRYNARDLAVYRANIHKIPVILGSATPSLESLYNYKLKKYALFKLTVRGVVGAVLPQIKLLDINHAELFDGLTGKALEAIRIRLANQELSLIYINRRGYAPVISCYECGWVSRCRHCSSNMVYHNSTKILKCHHCGLSCKLPKACPKCNSLYLQTIGQGTQKVEEILAQYFPDARILRVDHDTTTNKKSWDILYDNVRNNKVDILIGTQMLAKGHDFPNLTLVIGLNLDSGLYSYDFRATELLFIQLMQVSGRAGRGGKPGEVILQTAYPEHELYKFLLKHDFAGFANYLLKQRKLLSLPPYTFYVLFRASSKNIETTMDFLVKVATIMQQNVIGGVNVFSAVPCVMQKLKGKERGQILCSATKRTVLHDFIDKVAPLINSIKFKSDILCHFDVDPFEI